MEHVVGGDLQAAWDALPTSPELQLLLSCTVCALLHILRIITDPILLRLAFTLGAPSTVKANKFAHQGLNLVFHAVATFYLYDVIYVKEKWLEPEQYGDNGEKIWDGYPSQKDPTNYHAFFCFEFGYHLQRLVAILIHRDRDDFVEMLAHHGVTVFPIGSVVNFHYLRIGLCVLFIHDSSDILACLVKMVNALGHKITSVLIFLPMCGIWFYTRLFLMPYWILPIAHTSPQCSVKWPCFASLVILIALNAYWFYLFGRMFWLAISSGGKRVEDLQEDGAKVKAQEVGERSRARRQQASSPAPPLPGGR